MFSRRVSMTILAILGCAAVLVGCPTGISTWTLTFGNTGEEEALALVGGPSGSWAIAGWTNSTALGANGTDMCLVNVKSDGDIDWYNIFGGAGDQEAKAMDRTVDGGYILAGYTLTGTYKDALIVKVTPLGVQSWSNDFGGGDDDELFAVQQVSGGGYIVAGLSKSSGAGDADFYLVKTLSDGTVDWDQVYGNTVNEAAYAVRQTADGGYILVGSAEIVGAALTDMYVVKTDASGVLQWSSGFGSPTGYDDARDVLQTSDGGYLVLGMTTGAGTTNADVYLVKLNAAGMVQWSKTYGGVSDDKGTAIVPAHGGGYILVGQTKSYGKGQWDVYMIKVDASGVKQWERVFGGGSDDAGHAVAASSDGGYVMAGATMSYGIGAGDFYAIKTDGNGNGASAPTP